MIEAGHQASFCACLIDEWIELGMQHVVLCPGSRSTPMVLALASRPEIICHVRLDERSAAFFALGLAKATQLPVGILVTSGTAAAELFAATCEADLGHVPLLLLTADRPPELQGLGAPQTMDQVDLFGRHIRRAFSVDPRDLEASHWRGLAREAFAGAQGLEGLPGPVQVNLMFSEPLVGSPGDLPLREPFASIPDASPIVSAEAIAAACAAISGLRGLVVAGEAEYSPEEAFALAHALGWPLLADPRSRTQRAGEGICGSELIVAAQHPALVPEAIIRLGSQPTSKAVNAMIAEAARSEAPVLLIDHSERPLDPDGTVTMSLIGPMASNLHKLTAAVDQAIDASWRELWASAEGAIQRYLDDALGTELSEPAVARLISSLDLDLMVSSSMPIRDLETFAAASAKPPRVFANRGLNGIDGVNSTALGIAEGTLKPLLLSIGDLAFLHDLSALLDQGTSDQAACTVLVLDNQGGGIFSFLPQHEVLDSAKFERFYGTPRKTSVAEVVRGFGIELHQASRLDELSDLLKRHGSQAGFRVIHLALASREENLKLHRALGEGSKAALWAALEA